MDIWTFEEIPDQAEALLKGVGEAGMGKSGINEEITKDAEMVIRMYGGHFLSGEGNQA
jgi:hypothetical protein